MGRGGQEDSENEEEVAPDERIDWILSRIQTSLKCKEEQIQKLMATDAARYVYVYPVCLCVCVCFASRMRTCWPSFWAPPRESVRRKKKKNKGGWVKSWN